MEKVYISTKENIWNELTSVNITEEENAIINSEDLNLKSKKFELIKSIKDRQIKVLSKEDLLNIKTKYIELKNSLNLDKKDTYIFISSTILCNNNIYTGIINYNINKEHKQLRF